MKCLTAVITACAVVLCSNKCFGAGTDERIMSEMPVMSEIYVSLSGDDNGDGTTQHPFRTIERAQEAVRERNSNMTGNIDVILDDGTYFLNKPLRFDVDDSGSNGYYVRYRSANENQATISGGQILRNIEERNGLWIIEAQNIEYVSELYVNNKKAKKAQSGNTVEVEDIYKAEESEYGADGVIVSKESFAASDELTNMQMHFVRGWRDYLFNVRETVEVGEDMIALLADQPQFNTVSNPAVTTINHAVEKGSTFYAENVLSELDEAGEFYFDKNTSKIYYKPYEQEQISSSEIIAPCLEEMVTIEGKNTADKARNIEFDGLIFAHGAWYTPSRYGFITGQASYMYTLGKVSAVREPGIDIVFAHIQLECAEKVNFRNNIVKFMAGAGIGMYNGVTDCEIIGNVFEDIADAAITVGLLSHNYMTEPIDGYDLSTGKKGVLSCSNHPNLPQYNGNDGTNTCWAPYDSNDEGGHIHWWSIDLGEPQKIDRIELEPRLDSDQPTTRRNIEIIASNDSDFKTYSVLASVGSTPFSATDMLTLRSVDEAKYRYVMVRKTVPEYFMLAEIRLINEDSEYIAPKEVCKNISIKNNFITRVGDGHYGAPGIHLFYTQNVNVSHNEITHVPYTGITSGWGWTSFRDSRTCKDNVIAYNRIDGISERAMDGGGVYTLGNQPNTVICGNYFTNQYNCYGTVYLDAGSQFYQVYDNVMENVLISNFPNSGGKDLTFWNNYATAPGRNNAGLDTVENVKYYIPGNPPEEVLQIMTGAGLESDYKHIKEKADTEERELTLDMKYQNVIHELRHQADSTLVSNYLANKVIGVYELLKLAEVGNELGQYPQEAYDKLKAKVDEANGAAKTYPVDRWKVVEESDAVTEALNEFAASKIKVSLTALTEYAENMLASAEIGSEVGQYTQEQYDILSGKLADVKERSLSLSPDSEEAEYLYLELEAASNSFKNSCINLNITDFHYPGQSGQTVYDEENGIIYTKRKRTTDLSQISPSFSTNPYVKVSPEAGEMQNFLEDVKYVVTTEDGSASKTWTVKTQMEDTVNSNETVTLDDIVNDSANWVSGAAYASTYEGKTYGDCTVEFDIEISANANDWPGFTFRNKYAEIPCVKAGTDGYIIIFNAKSLEFYRFNDGVRFQFIGEIPELTPAISATASYKSFKFGERNRIKLTTRNEEDGVRIVCWVNGEEVINVLDNYDGAILEPGYFGYVAPASQVTLYRIDEEKSTVPLLVKYRGQDIEFPIAPRVENDRTLVPMRAIMEAMGAQVSWNEETQTAVAAAENTTVAITVNDTVARVNGETVTLDVPVRMYGDYTMIPVRFLAERLGHSVVWDDVSNTVYID